MKEKNKDHFWITMLGILLFIPFLGSVHLFDWDEINFAESAREMLLTGNWGTVQINFETFWEKPPFFFWLQALSMSLFGVNEFAARLPNAIAGILTLNFIWYIGKTHFKKELAMWWVLGFLASLTPHLYFRSGIIDPVFNLLVFTSIYQLFLSSIEKSVSMRRALLFGLFLGLAVLTKGPVAILLVGLVFVSVLIWTKKIWFNYRHFIFALLATVTPVLLWLTPQLIANGPAFLSEFIQYQIDLLTKPVASHGQPWFCHPIILLIGCFPISILSIPELYNTNSKHNFDPWMKSLFWVVLIVFSVVTTKIVHYSSLCYLPLTFLFARFMLREKSNVRGRGILVFSTGLIGILLLALIFGIIWIGNNTGEFLSRFGSKIKDSFALANLSAPNEWGGYEYLLLFLLLIAIVLMFLGILRWNKRLIGVSLLLNTLFVSSLMTVVVPRIEAYTQKSIIEFYESIQEEECYVHTYKFKSYAHYFYSQTNPLKAQDDLFMIRSDYFESHGVSSIVELTSDDKITLNDKIFSYLVEGELDKNVYIICQEKKREDLLAKNELKEILAQGGFYVFQRKANINSRID